MKNQNVHVCVLCVFQQLQPNKFEYREGKEYHILYHIQNGSYGDVFSVQDRSTGFECAAKKVCPKYNRVVV